MTRKRLISLLVIVGTAVALIAPLAGGAVAREAGHASSTGQRLPGTDCPAFPADSVWNTPVTGLPVDRHSREWLTHMAAGSTYLHPDYGPGGGSSPYGIPWQITSPNPHFVRVHF